MPTRFGFDAKSRVQFLNLSDLPPETPDLLPEEFELIHIVSLIHLDSGRRIAPSVHRSLDRTGFCPSPFRLCIGPRLVTRAFRIAFC